MQRAPVYQALNCHDGKEFIPALRADCFHRPALISSDDKLGNSWTTRELMTGAVCVQRHSPDTQLHHSYSYRTDLRFVLRSLTSPTALRYCPSLQNFGVSGFGLLTESLYSNQFLILNFPGKIVILSRRIFYWYKCMTFLNHFKRITGLTHLSKYQLVMS